MFDFDFDDIDREKLKKYILIGIIIFFGVIGLFLIFPFLFYLFCDPVNSLVKWTI